VACEKEFIHFAVPTKNPFRGRVFVKGEYSNGDCVRIYDLTETDERASADVQRHEINGKSARDEATGAEFQPNKGGFPNYEHGNWRDFLKGGDAKNEVDCAKICKQYSSDEPARLRRQTKTNSAELDIRLGQCNAQRDRTVKQFDLK
jgi:hypothetical protein